MSNLDELIYDYKVKKEVEKVTSFKVTGFDIPFWDLVMIFVKMSFAMIPALIIIFFVIAILSLFGITSIAIL